MQNIIYLGADNPVVIDFTFDGDFEAEGLLNFTDIKVMISGEEYSLSANPANILVVSKSELRISIGDTTALSPGYYHPVIEGYSDIYDDGYVLCSIDSELGRVKVVNV